MLRDWSLGWRARVASNPAAAKLCLGLHGSQRVADPACAAEWWRTCGSEDVLMFKPKSLTTSLFMLDKQGYPSGLTMKWQQRVWMVVVVALSLDRQQLGVQMETTDF